MAQQAGWCFVCELCAWRKIGTHIPDQQPAVRRGLHAWWCEWSQPASHVGLVYELRETAASFQAHTSVGCAADREAASWPGTRLVVIAGASAALLTQKRRRTA